MRLWFLWALTAHVLVVRASLVDTIVTAIEQAVDCTSCHALLGVLSGVALLGDTVFSDALIGACEALGVEDDDVCQGLIGQQGPILAHDLRSISVFDQTSTKFCNALIGLCQPPAVNQHTQPIPKPAPPNPKQFVSTGKTPFQVVHFSDVHIDRSYTPGSEVNCTKPICCRNFADQTGPVEVPAGPMGSHNCDTTGALTESMLRAAESMNPSFSIFTGDVVEAAIWLVSQTENTADMEDFNNEMVSILSTPVYPAIGNHEAAPVNSFPRNTSTSAPSSQWVFDTQSQGWSQWLGSTATSQVQHNSGSYAVNVPGTNLKIISLNTIYWYKDNFWLFDSDTFQPDPNGVLAFAAAQLQAAEDAGQRAWIIAHMPPSSGDALLDQSNYFDQLVQRYKNTIASQFYGHSHDDEFAIAYTDYNNQTAANADSIAWIAPSLTPRDANAAFRVYDVDPDTYEIMDSRTFISDLSDPNFQTNPTWELEYSARDTYGPAIGGWPSTESLNPAFWHHVTEAFATNTPLFQQFNSFKTRGAEVIPCDAACQTATICNLRALRAQNNCVVATPGFDFRRRSEISPVGNRRIASDHCEGVGMRSILSRIAGGLTPTESAALRKRLQEVFGDAE